MTVGTCGLKLSPVDNSSLLVVLFSRTDADESKPIVEQISDAMHDGILNGRPDHFCY
jgi:hypothetical protein